MDEKDEKITELEKQVETLTNKVKDGDAQRQELEEELEKLRAKPKTQQKQNDFLGGFYW